MCYVGQACNAIELMEGRTDEYTIWGAQHGSYHYGRKAALEPSLGLRFEEVPDTKPKSYKHDSC